ncbi:MAG: PadR family transcriptional regulator [Gemmatimonadota bacterium]
MTKEGLGDLEHQVLLVALRLEANAYSAAIVGELEARTGRDVAPAAVYIALRRLEEGGYVRSSVREKEARGVTRERRYFDVSARGLALLRTARRRYLNLWEGLEPLLGGSR